MDELRLIEEHRRAAATIGAKRPDGRDRIAWAKKAGLNRRPVSAATWLGDSTQLPASISASTRATGTPAACAISPAEYTSTVGFFGVFVIKGYARTL